MHDNPDAPDNTATLAAYVLKDIGPPAKAALPALRKGMSNLRHSSLRVAAAHAVWKIDGDTESTIPVLVKIVQEFQENRSNSLVEDALGALGDMGPQAKAAFPALQNEFDRAQGDRKKSLGEALKKILPTR